MFNIFNLKRLLAAEIIYAPTRNTAPKIVGPIRPRVQQQIPLVTLLTSESTGWDKETEWTDIKPYVFGQGSVSPHCLEIPALIPTPSQKDPTEKGDPIYTMEEGTTEIFLNLEETILLAEDAAKNMPVSTKRYLRAISGKWGDLADYFENNRFEPWDKILKGPTNWEENSNQYLAPFLLHVELSLLKRDHAPFSKLNLPVAEDLRRLLEALATTKNRAVTIILHGEDSVVADYEKELVAAAQTGFKNRTNLRWITLANISITDGKIQEGTEIPKGTGRKAKALAKQLKAGNKILQEFEARVEKYLETTRKRLLRVFLRSLLEDKYPNLENDLYLWNSRKEITVENVLQRKREYEEGQKSREEDNSGGTEIWKQFVHGEPPLKSLIQATEDPILFPLIKPFYSVFKAGNTGENAYSLPTELTSLLHNSIALIEILPRWEQFTADLPPVPSTQKTEHDIESQLERDLHAMGRLPNAINLYADLEKILAGNSDLAEDNPLKPIEAEFQKLCSIIAGRKKDTLHRLQAQIKKVGTLLTKNTQAVPTTCKVLSLYGEFVLGQTPTYPPTVVESLQYDDLEPKKLGDLQAKLQTHFAKHTSLVSQPFSTGTITGKKLVILPNPENYTEPSAFPSVPKNLQGKAQWEIIQGLLDPATAEKTKEEISAPAKIPLNIQLKPSTDPITELFLDIDQIQIEIFNPVIGKPTGFKESLLWRPTLTKQGIQWSNTALQAFGYELLASPAIHNYAERKVRKGERVLSPNYALTPYEMLAYYRNEQRAAQTTIVNPDTGKALWTEGKVYHITPSWDREQILVDNSSETEEEETPCTPSPELITIGSSAAGKIQGATRIERLTQVSINFGFSTFLVQGNDNRIHKIKETVGKDSLSIEKERIAIELDLCEQRKEEINKTYDFNPPKLKGLKSNEKKDPASKPFATPSILRERKDLTQKAIELEKELESWKPTIEDFLEAFPPEPPPLATQIYEDQLKNISKRIFQRFSPHLRETPKGSTKSVCTIKNYQLRNSALMALKRSAANGSPPGSGKTIMAIMASWAMGHHYNLIICPTIAINTWAKELERLGLHHEVIGYRRNSAGIWRSTNQAYSDIRALTKRTHNRERTHNRLGLIEPEYFIISAETLSLGGEGNLRFSPWHYDVPITKKLAEALKTKPIPPHWNIVKKPIKYWRKSEYEAPEARFQNQKEVWYADHLRIWCDRINNKGQIQEYGFESLIKSSSFRRAIKACPKCSANGDSWSERGHCRECGHNHSALTKEKAGWGAEETRKPAHVSCRRGKAITATPPAGTTWKGTKTSNLQYPCYKLMGKHFGAKIIDEIHNYSSFHSQHGNALLQISTKDTLVLSGTLCRTHINELEPTLCHIYEPNSGEFPYTPWGMELFNEQFSTYEIKNQTEFVRGIRKEFKSPKRRKTILQVPEASNLTKLRALMHGILCSVSERELAKEWNLRPIRERIRYVELEATNTQIYNEWEQKIQDAFAACATEKEKADMIRNSRHLLTHLAYACDGPEKLRETINWIREGMAENKRMVVVGPSTRFYKVLLQELKTQGIPHHAIGALAPEKRFEALNKFRDSGCPLLISRTRLINVNFNQLVCCQKLLFTGIDPSPSIIRQMQMRLNRIGQENEVECDFLITRRPVQPPRQLLGRRGAAEPARDLEEEIDQALGNPNSIPKQSTEPEVPIDRESFEARPPSYEERLFATVLRRENAIKAVLNQADRQRDPQELYDLLKERLTLNQVLQDIATQATLEEITVNAGNVEIRSGSFKEKAHEILPKTEAASTPPSTTLVSPITTKGKKASKPETTGQMFLAI